MKRFIILIVIFVCVGMVLSAQNKVSAGLGNLGLDFTGLSFSDENEALKSSSIFNDLNGKDSSFGFFGFFDAVYAEANVGMGFGKIASSELDDKKTLVSDEKTGLTYLSVGLLGKYPIDLGVLTLFPLLGAEYRFPLVQKDDKKPDLKSSGKNGDLKNNDYSNIWVRLGVGGDVNITDMIYVRPTFLYGIRLKTEGEKKQVSAANHNSGNRFAHGFNFRLAAGFRF